MDGGAWWAVVHGVAKSQTRLSNFTFTFHVHALEKEMTTHSSVLAWRIPGTGEPNGLPSMGSHRFGHDWSDLTAAGERMGTISGWNIDSHCSYQDSLLKKKNTSQFPVYLWSISRILKQFVFWWFCPILSLLLGERTHWAPHFWKPHLQWKRFLILPDTGCFTRKEGCCCCC